MKVVHINASRTTYVEHIMCTSGASIRLAEAIAKLRTDAKAAR